jgi:acylphosphatase
MERRACTFVGHVQGVGFRYTAQHLARRLGLRGYVRNLGSGDVELVMEGEPADMDQLMEDLRQRLGSYIRKVSVNTAPATAEFPDFSIRY